MSGKTKNPKFLAFLACLAALCLALGACSAPAPEQPEDAAALLDAIVASASSSLGEENPMPKTETDAILAANSQAMLGISEADFNQYAETAFASNALISTFAHEVALVKCKDVSSAEKLQSLIAEGFDPYKWICVMPESCKVVASGRYVLLTVSHESIGTALIAGFKENSGAALGEVNAFFSIGEGELPQPSGGGFILN
ncbi:MAG: DUF4358 domain-containing protein [Christensenellaceae bacterium]|jgi:hypothetical protein|nr:DUF4358 domain-containing protein [Christensenellaceae bacterium]